LYIRFVQGGNAWGGFDFKEMFNYRLLCEFVKLGIPGCLMMCSEWWAFEIMALLAGILGKTSLAAQSVLMSSCSLTYMIPLGIGVSSSTLIGNALGAGDGRTAQVASRAALALGLITASMTCFALISLRKHWGYMWDDDQEVASLVETILPLVAFFQLSDATGAIGGGILRGTGKQKFGAIINLVAYYIIGMPLGVCLAFPPFKGMQSMGLFGLWVGLTIGLLSVSVFQIGFILFLDWNQEVANAKARLELENDGYAAIPWAADEDETEIDEEDEVFHDSV
jgi:MATE family multidrug resistance protein